MRSVSEYACEGFHSSHTAEQSNMIENITKRALRIVKRNAIRFMLSSMPATAVTKLCCGFNISETTRVNNFKFYRNVALCSLHFDQK